MRTERAVRRAIAAIERRLRTQLAEILRSEKGFGGPESLFFDELLLQRHTLRFVLGLRHEPWHPLVDWERFRDARASEARPAGEQL